MHVLNRLGRAIAAALIAGAIFAAPVSSSAQADDAPFWEKSDSTKNATTSGYKQIFAKKKSSKTYAKSYAKKKVYASSKPGKKLGGYAEASEPKRKKKGVRVAALGGGAYSGYESKKSLTGGGVRWVANAGCLDGALKSVIHSVASNFGPVTVSSTCRSRGHNRAVGGAPKSKHLSGDAVDFRVHGNIRGVHAFLRSSGSVGGLKHYGGGLFHIDNGDRRSW